MNFTFTFITVVIDEHVRWFILRAYDQNSKSMGNSNVNLQQNNNYFYLASWSENQSCDNIQKAKIVKNIATIDDDHCR